MTRLLLACLLALAIPGCGVQPSGVITGAAPPTGRAATITLYLVSAGRVTSVRRPEDPRALADTLALLAAGPTDEERANGLTTEVPQNAVPFSVTAKPSGITVTTPASGLSTVANEQIVCTVGAAVEAVDPTQISVIAGGQVVTSQVSCPP